MAKKAVSELLDSLKLISHKIWETEKSWNFHTQRNYWIWQNFCESNVFTGEVSKVSWSFWLVQFHKIFWDSNATSISLSWPWPTKCCSWLWGLWKKFARKLDFGETCKNNSRKARRFWMQSIVAKTLVKLSIQNTYKTDMIHVIKDLYFTHDKIVCKYNSIVFFCDNIFGNFGTTFQESNLSDAG